MAGNLLGYLFLVVLSRNLDPAQYGAIGGLLGFGLVSAILSVSLQLVVARATAGVGSGREVPTARSSISLALTAMLIVWAVTPLAVRYLHLDSPWPVLWVGLMLFPVTVSGALLGHLLGRQQFVRLAAATVLVAAMRFASALVAGWAGWGVTGTLAALTVSTFAAAIALVLMADVRSWWTLRAPMLRRDFVVVLQAAARVAAFLVLSNLDVLVARHYLNATQSGVYVLASIFAKAGLWGPQFIAVLVFPKISAGGPRLPLFGRAAALTLGFGVALSLGVDLFAPRLITLISGPAYLHAADYAAGFVLLGTGLALTHLAMVTSIAIGERRFGIMTWAAAAVELVVISLWAHSGIGEILLVSLAVTYGLAVAGAVVTLSHRSVVGEAADNGVFTF